MTPQPVTAASVAVALVAASRISGIAPERVFDSIAGAGRTRCLAAAGCMAALGWTAKDAGRVFRLTPTNLAPSSLKARKVEPEQVAVVAEALSPGGERAGRFREAPAPVSVAATPSPPSANPADAAPPPLLTTIPARVLGWARRMRANTAEGRPAWSFGEIAKMFEIDAGELREALS